MSDALVLVFLSLAGVAVVAIGMLAWVSRSPRALDNPWIAMAFFLAIFMVAAVLAPFWAVLLALVLPAAIVALVIYLITRPRGAA